MQVGIVLGSRYQWNTMQHTAELLAELGISYEARIITVNKNTNKLHDYVSKATNRGLEIIITGSTDEAYLSDIISSKTELPVLSIKLSTSKKKKNIDNSMIDKHKGRPISTLSAGQEDAANAALCAASMLADKYPRIREKLINYRSQNTCGKSSRKTIDALLKH